MPAEAEKHEIRDPEQRDVPREKRGLKLALGIPSVFLAAEVISRRSLLRERFGIAHTTIQIEEQGMQEGEGGTACEGRNIKAEQGRSEK